ncbi:hypothetical protein DTO271G3_939 [Paecilomyces variotii]|nr:hypothetical protein DTO271G3_939 [Paecilomyces variotii]
MRCKRNFHYTAYKKDSIQNWNDVASLLLGRTNKDCRKRWSKVQADIQKGVWRQEEDERLHNAVQQLGFKWSRVATIVQCRTADQRAKRWQQVLRPDLNHTSWTPEEDEKLLAAIKTYDNNWKKISLAEFPDRSTHDIRNRSRNTSGRVPIPAQLQTPGSNEDEMVLCRDENADDNTSDDRSECEYTDGRDIPVDPDLGVGSSSVAGFQHTHGSLTTAYSAGTTFGQNWAGTTNYMQHHQEPPVPDNDWLSWCSPFEGSSPTTSSSQIPWLENGPAAQHCFPSSILSDTGVFEVSGNSGLINSMGGLGSNMDTSTRMHDGDMFLENGQKGNITLTLDQVDPNVAHEIMGSVLKQSTGLKIRCVVNIK